ncbi:unnamed protein product [Lepeophtheirus salmonis]|uniref:(salmon louse) hypothetical protein n=1 Tax=Lepeophtheirus salmonis TaxID=72036 RepID=A0A817FEG4_LEPSM|nr:unnamed protein product [Lepeophtheirus salmonis]
MSRSGWQRITVKEISAALEGKPSPAGPDGVLLEELRTVCRNKMRDVLCVLTETDWLPVDFVKGRTTLIPKKEDARNASDFCPITVTNHLLRCFHKAIAKWLGEFSPTEDYQLANKEWDGCGRGILLLDSIIRERQMNKLDLGVAWLDFAKTFDSVSHQSIAYVLRKRLVPEGIVSYIQKGDPLSGYLFNMVLEEVIKECSNHLGGVSALGSTFSVLAYADDTVLLADSLSQLELAVGLFGATASKMGLCLNLNKSSYKYSQYDSHARVWSYSDLIVRGNPISPLSKTVRCKYLGLPFGEQGVLSTSLSDDLRIRLRTG